MRRRQHRWPAAIQQVFDQGDSPCDSTHVTQYEHPPLHYAVQRELVRQQLQQQLLQVDFQAFQLLMQRLLTEMGYTPVSTQRKHWKGRTCRGGRDFEVSAETGLTHGLVIVQIKHYTRPVQRRFVDELRGTMLRLGARHGLLITTSAFPQGAREAAAGDGVAPIRLIDGETLLDLCFIHQLGVNRLYQNTKGGSNSAECEESWELDTVLFERLAQTVHPASARQTPSKGQKMCHNGGLPSGDLPAPGVPVMAQPMVAVPVWRQVLPVNAASTDGTVKTITKEISTTKTNREATSFLGGDMTWRTHTIAGLGSLWLLSLAPNGVTPHNLALVAACAALGSLLPDLDAAESKIKHLRIAGVQPFAPIAVSFFRGLGHRGLLHSLLGLTVIAAVSLLLTPWFDWQVPLALILGYASHLATDALTRSGIPWLYPHHQRYHLLPPRWRFVTGSYAELVLFPFLALLFSLLLLRVLKPGHICAVQVATTLVHKRMFPLPFHLVGRLEQIGFQFHQDILWHRWRGWDRRGGVMIQHPYPGYYYPNRVIEYILVFRKPGRDKLFAGRSPAQRESSRIAIDDLYTKEIGTNLWHIAAVQPHSLEHPCPFPEELAYRLITLYSYRGDKVLDPFLGSGTTAKVAKLTGRDYYGYEVNPAFLKLTKQRLREPTLQRQDWMSRFQRLSALNRGSIPPKTAALKKAAPEKAASPEAVFPGQPSATAGS